ncbi:TIR domain-containing adapter molecule 1 [Conger conger]|uniref:TIR domain-containing adapter molecule 1 n=1 Tax=Conger conger TaxID=82655 RepID=UPI002A5A85AA|nr:TIR domain-containing adapter molecule 1 [Conger conger]
MSEREREARAEAPQTQAAGDDGAGVALEDAFKLLSLAQRDRLLSLTLEPSRSRAEVLVRAMSLIDLGKGDEALEKLRPLGDVGVARSLAEMLERHGGGPEAAPRGGGVHPEPGVDAAIELAGIFRVLAEEKLCHESRRDKAYQAALWACSRQTGNGEGRGTLERLVQEAREVCGSDFGVRSSTGATSYQDGETLSAPAGLCSFSPLGGRESGGASAAVRIPSSRGSEPSGTEVTSSPPSSLRTVPCSLQSYPSHLEVSVSPTALFDVHHATRDVQDPRSPLPQVDSSVELQERTLTPGPPSAPGGDVAPGCSPTRVGTREHSAQCFPLGEKLSASVSLRVAPRGCAPQQGPLSVQPGSAGLNHVTDHGKNSGTSLISTPASAETKAGPTWDSPPERPGKTAEPSPSASASISEDRQSESQGKHGKQDDDEEEEEFFSFVILHSPKDVELAGRLRERLEGLDVGLGATFSQDFAMPGRHRLSCVDDAINNSAFVILLLSRNFDRRMLEFETNCALTSSLENRHKYNNVIPLLPSENALPREQIPGSLKIFVMLEEGGRGFEKKVRKAMAPGRIERQRSVWRQERSIRAREESRRRMREDNERSAALQREAERMQKEQLRHSLSEQQRALEHYWALWNAQAGQVPAPGVPPFPFYVPMSPRPPEGFPSLGGPFLQPSIHIENASCIMIGNDSQMTVGMGGEREENGPGHGPGPGRDPTDRLS